ncbi:uncharacterized protein MELLADRAFT_106583 [Melampsora larici-populina 98AG31]|uniref:NAD-dependent epimerase/dehydratase domain-containing protein n=1 Tax=Melampsora larici-populina (strain 98AG31 / pathotype 3-4-7) TaxID=747676 RepID=F4RLZ3_MELLP|nr:uncharacterized protein MELLADRAFT_106583 [Melampsora larici-populina 98AG31]EGG06633.1 hypothetical protein MELLADRAFT_106583 [Melampsora larici-populina 98AG31]
MKVLVTGITGFVGSHIAKGFLDLNWEVVGTVRSATKGETLLKQPTFSGAAQAQQLRYIVVDDLATYDFSTRLQDVDAIAHTASPCHFTGKSLDEYITPAVKGTSNLLMAARDSPTVKAVAVTSSFGAVLDFRKPALEQSGKTYTEDDWFTGTYEEAAAQNRAGFWYATSKTLAEREAWRIKDLEGTKWSLATICPPSIYGPVIHTSNPDDMNVTSRRLYNIFFGNIKDVIKTDFPAFIDVRDVADAHIKAILQRTTDRFLTSAALYDFQKVSDFVHEKFGEEAKRAPIGQPHHYLKPQQVYLLDSSKVVNVLGLSMRSFKETISDTFKNYLQINKDLTSSRS